MNRLSKRVGRTLTMDELAVVAGGHSIGAHSAPEVKAQDMYGNTLSIEDWMDYQLYTAGVKPLDASMGDRVGSIFNP